MAKAVRIVTPAPVPTPPPPTVEYALTLTDQEARTLRSLTGHNIFGGEPVTEGIFDALARAGVPYAAPLFSGTVRGIDA